MASVCGAGETSLLIWFLLMSQHFADVTQWKRSLTLWYYYDNHFVLMDNHPPAPPWAPMAHELTHILRTSHLAIQSHCQGYIGF